MSEAIDCTLRELELHDLDALLALYQQLHPQDDPLPERAEVERIWQRILSDPDQIYVGAFVAGELIAACNAAIIPNLTRGARPYAVIENVVTREDRRRQGFGARAMQALVERCVARRCYKVMLMSAQGRAGIHGFYEALGFDRTAKQAFVLKAK